MLVVIVIIIIPTKTLNKETWKKKMKRELKLSDLTLKTLAGELIYMLQVNYFHCPRNYWWTNENDVVSSTHRKRNNITAH